VQELAAQVVFFAKTKNAPPAAEKCYERDKKAIGAVEPPKTYFADIWLTRLCAILIHFVLSVFNELLTFSAKYTTMEKKIGGY
jgi:hypothetical protein